MSRLLLTRRGVLEREASFVPGITFVNSSITADASGTTVVVTKPSGLADGDVMIAHIAANTTGNGTYSAPAGWTLIDSRAQTSMTDAVYFKVVTNAAGEPANYTFTTATASKTGIIVAYRGVDTDYPINNFATDGQGSGGTLTAPSITTTRNACMIVATFCNFLGQALSDPAGTSLRAADENGVAPSAQVVDIEKATAGATSTIVSTAGTSSVWVARQIALNVNFTPGVTFVNAQQTVDTAGTTVVVTKPTGLADGDILVAHLVGLGGGHSAPAGWTQIGATISATVFADSFWYKLVTSAAGEPATYTFNTTSNTKTCRIVAYRGVDQEYPIGAFGTANALSSGPAISPSVLADTNSLIVTTFATDSISPLADPPQLAIRSSDETATSASSQLGDFVQATGGASPTFSSTLESSNSWTARAVVLRAEVTPAIAFVNATETAVTVANTAITIAKPTGLANGDVLIAVLMIVGTVNVMTLPTGWVEAERKSSSLSTCTFYKVITNAAGEPANYTFSGLSATRVMHGQIVAYRGVDPDHPLQRSTHTISTSSTASADTVTTLNPNSLVVVVHAVNANLAAASMSNPFQEVMRIQNEDTNAPNMQIGDVWHPIVGATPVYASALSGSVTWIAQQIVLNPILVKPAITYVGGAMTADIAAGGNITIEKPADIQNGDVLFCHIASNAASTIDPTIAGWVRADDRLASGSAFQDVLFYRVITNAAGEPANYSFSSTAGVKTGVILAYRGVSNNNPIGAFVNATGSSTLPSAPSITTIRASLILVTYSTATTNNPLGGPPGVSGRFADVSSASGPSTKVGEVPQVAAGATQVYTATQDSSSTWVARQIAINPAAPSEVQFVAASSGSANGTANLSVPKPTGTVDGDLMVMAAAISNDTITAPAGWNILQSETADPAFYVWYRFASSEGGSYVLSHANADVVAAIVTYRNVAAISNSADLYTALSGLPLDVPDSTSVVANSLALHIGGQKDSSGLFVTPHANVTSRVEVENVTSVFATLAMGDELLGAAGTVTGRDWTLNTAKSNRYGAIVVLAPV